MRRAQAGQAIEALPLSDVALAADAKHQAALRARLKALEVLRDCCRNSNKRTWLEFNITQTKNKLAAKR